MPRKSHTEYNLTTGYGWSDRSPKKREKKRRKKSRDALGFLNEQFKPSVMGSDLEPALVQLMNTTQLFFSLLLRTLWLVDWISLGANSSEMNYNAGK